MKAIKMSRRFVELLIAVELKYTDSHFVMENAVY